MLARYLFYLSLLRRNLYADTLKLREIQSKKLRSIIRHAYETIPFYHRKFSASGIKPDDIRSIDDLIKLPTTVKTEIQREPLEDLISHNIDAKRCTKTMTSGSTGMPLTVAGDDHSEDFNLAVWTRAMMENGLRLTDKMALVKNPLYFGKRERLSKLLRRRYISVFEDVDRQLETLENYKPNVIRGYASSLAMLADSNKARAYDIEPRLIFSGGELLTKNHRNKISSVFACDVLDYYACVEVGLLMWECSRHGGYHMNVDSVATEILKNGETVGPGEEGEIACTSLGNYAMPLIRYRLGDIASLSKERCPCGRTLPLMKVLKGRSDDLLTALNGTRIYASSFFYNLFGHMEKIRQFRVVQEKRDQLVIQLVVREEYSDCKDVLQIAIEEIHRMFGEGMTIDFQVLDKIQQDSTGKLRYIVSHLGVH